MSTDVQVDKPTSVGYLTVQRLLFPPQGEIDTRSLYVDHGEAYSQESGNEGGKHYLPTTPSQADTVFHAQDLLSENAMLVRSGSKISFGTYFNAFPASYWRRWTVVDAVRLTVRTSGFGTIVVYKSNARGALQRVAASQASGEHEASFDLPLASFGDGGWYWFDLVAGEDNFVLQGAQWQAKTERTIAKKITVGITTLNKPDFCLNNLKLLASSPQALDYIYEILLVDQGTRKVAAMKGFEEIALALGDKLRIIDQSNLGGSGGFARSMLEAVDNGSDYALLLDDDIVVQPDSIERMVIFAGLCKKPTIVGGHMFDLYNRTVLHSFGESVNPYRTQPQNSLEEAELGHNFAANNLRQTPWLHRRADVEYNGWWMCLIPVSIMREIGLSLPIFLKWDDAEYGMRAKKRGYTTVTLPGAAVWHMSWIDKDDLVGWQAYFHTRNRLLTAALHSPYEWGGRLIRELIQQDVKHLVSMQYYSVAGRHLALRDFLEGPQGLVDLLPSRLARIRGMAEKFTDARFQKEPDDFPEPRMAKPPRKGKGFTKPNYAQLLPWTVRTVLRQLSEPVQRSYRSHPQAQLPHIDNNWWRMSQYDSVLVSNAEGTALSWYQRDPHQLRQMLKESGELHARLIRNWMQLKREYRRQHAHLTSIETWRDIFRQYGDPKTNESSEP